MNPVFIIGFAVLWNFSGTSESVADQVVVHNNRVFQEPEKWSPAILDRQAVLEPIYTWPNARVPYLISDVFSNGDQQIILAAMDEFHRYTCVRMVPRTTEPDYVLFIEHGSGLCWAGRWGDPRVGRLGGIQFISLIRSSGCLRKYNVLHELMHVLGFWHEQQRHDRDLYVDINFNNIKLEYRDAAFGKRTLSGPYPIQDLGTPYDYNSIMSYHPFSFAIDPQVPTMLARDGCSPIGNEVQLSKIDVLRVNRLYQCPYDPERPTPPRLESCTDTNPSCHRWARNGYCERYPFFMGIRGTFYGICRKSCRVCCPSSYCVDDDPFCSWWASVGECGRNPDYMYRSCRRSCGIC